MWRNKKTAHLIDIDNCAAAKPDHAHFSGAVTITPTDLETKPGDSESAYEKIHAKFLEMIAPGDDVLSGSTRGNLSNDLYCSTKDKSGHTPSLTAILTKIANCRGAELRKFLFSDIGDVGADRATMDFRAPGANWDTMADSLIINSQTPGTNWKIIENAWADLKRDEIQWNEEESKWEKQSKSNTSNLETILRRKVHSSGSSRRVNNDEPKILLLYACMQYLVDLHKIDGKNPMDVNFYDNHRGILASCSHFFEKHPALIPKGIKLKLYHYAPRNGTANKPKQYRKTIVGVGFRHERYYNVVKETYREGTIYDKKDIWKSAPILTEWYLGVLNRIGCSEAYRNAERDYDDNRVLFCLTSLIFILPATVFMVALIAEGVIPPISSEIANWADNDLGTKNAVQYMALSLFSASTMVYTANKAYEHNKRVDLANISP